MTKMIVHFLNFVLNVTAILFILGCSFIGVSYFYDTPEAGLEVFIIMAILGAIVGFILATIILGIPLLLLRINQNLEEINKTIQKNINSSTAQ